MGDRIKERITDFFSRFCYSRRGSLVALLVLLTLLIFVNLCVFSFFYFNGENHLKIPSLFLSGPRIALCLTFIFVFNLLVGRIPHYEVIQNPLEDKKDIILEQKNTYDVLKNLDDGTTADKTLPSDQTKFVKITRINNRHIFIQIVVLISLTAPRLLMPLLVKRRKEYLEHLG